LILASILNTEYGLQVINGEYDIDILFTMLNTAPNSKIPMVYCSTLMSVAYGKIAKETVLDGQIIKAGKLEEIAKK